MTAAMFYDFETSGLPDWSQPSEAPQQPHIVEAAAKVIDLSTRTVIDQFNVIVRPDGWTIEAEAGAIHGITMERALAEGVPEEEVVTRLSAMAKGRTRIGYNQDFDARIFRIALFRFRDEAQADAWKKAPSQCAAVLATPIVKSPPTKKMMAANRFHHKKPTLGEAYLHFMGKPMEGAHTAMGDVDALVAIWFAMHPESAA